MADLVVAIDARKGTEGANQWVKDTDRVDRGARKADHAIRGVDGRLRNAKGRFVSTGKSARRFGGELSGAAGSSNRLASAMGRLLAPMAALAAIGKSVNIAAEVEATQTAFISLVGEQERAMRLFEGIRDFAASTPFQFAGLADSARLALALGSNAEQAFERMKIAADASAAFNKGEEGIKRIVLALGQMEAKGKVSAEEMNQLAEVGIGGFNMLAKAMGRSQEEVRELSAKGLIPAKEAVAVLWQSINREYLGSADKLSKTTKGLVSTLKDNVVRTAGEIGTAIIEAFDVRGKLDSMIEFTKTVGPEMGKVVRYLAGVEGALDGASAGTQRFAKGIEAVTLAAGAFVAVRFAQSVLQAGVAVAAFASGPVGALTLAVGAAVLAYQQFKDQTVEVRDVTTTVGDIVAVTWEVTMARAAAAWRLLVAVTDTTWQAIKTFATLAYNGVRAIFIDPVTSLLETFGINWSSLFDGIASAAKAVVNAITATFVGFFNFISKRAQRLIDIFRAMGKFDVRDPLESAKRVGDALQKALSIRGFAKDAKAEFSQAFSRDFVSEAIGAVQSFGVRFKKEMAEAIGEGGFNDLDLLTNIDRLFEDFVRGIRERASRSRSLGSGASGIPVANGADALEGARKSSAAATDALAGAQERLNAAMDKGSGSTKKAAQEAKGLTVAYADQMERVRDFEDTGEILGRGFGYGFQDAFDTILEKGRVTARELKDIFKSVASDIASALFNRFVVQRIVDGIASGIGGLGAGSSGSGATKSTPNPGGPGGQFFGSGPGGSLGSRLGGPGFNGPPPRSGGQGGDTYMTVITKDAPSFNRSRSQIAQDLRRAQAR